jgi:hypothetical protein
MTDKKFCIVCGAELQPGTQYCPSCGAAISPQDGMPATTVVQTRPTPGSQSLRTVAILCLIWGVVAVAVAIPVLSSAVSFVDMVIDQLKDAAYDSTRSMWDYYSQEMGMTRDLLIQSMYLLGGLLLASGLLALISAFCSYKNVQYSVAFVTLLLSAVCSCIGLITLVIGIIVLIKLSKCKEAFTS